MRVLGVDLGLKRIGLAVGEVEAAIATPRPVLQASGKLVDDALAIADLARQEEAERVIVGVPEGVEGSRSERAARLLADRLREAGLDVLLVDESLTSVEASAAMTEAGLSVAERRRRVDSEAACRILERYFEGHER